MRSIMMPKAIVTIAKYGPVTRKAGAAKIAPIIADNITAAIAASQKFHSSLVVNNESV